MYSNNGITQTFLYTYIIKVLSKALALRIVYEERPIEIQGKNLTMQVMDVTVEEPEYALGKENLLYKVLHPLFTMFKVTGLLNVDMKQNTRFALKLVWRIYQGLCLILVWFALFRVLPMQDFSKAMSQRMVARLLFLLWHFLAASEALQFSFFNQMKVVKFLFMWQKIQTGSCVPPYGNSIRLLMVINTIATLIASVMITWFQWDTSISIIDSAAYSAAPFPAGTNLPWVYNLCLTIIIQHACFIIGLVNASFVIFCLVLRMELAKHAADFRKAINNSTYLETIDALRKRHQQLCRLVEIADSIFRIPVAVVITISMTFLCVAARLFSIDGRWDMVSILVLSAATMWIFTIMFTFVITGAAVNDGVSILGQKNPYTFS